MASTFLIMLPLLGDFCIRSVVFFSEFCMAVEVTVAGVVDACLIREERPKCFFWLLFLLELAFLGLPFLLMPLILDRLFVFR